VTRSKVRRSGLATGALVLLAAAAWLVLAPTSIGGTTDYVTTNGDSMAPRFQTGDLALIRPANHYRVGDVVAYRSALLDAVVLHRLVDRDGDRYVFKGDNNDFLDPTRPDRSELIGRLWLRVPRGGTVLAWLQTPVIAATLTGGAALLLLLGTGSQRRRDRRRHGANGPHQGHEIMSRPRPHAVRRLDAHQMLTASAMAAAAFLVLGLLAFTRPATKPVTVKTPYTETVKFGYRATAPAGPVYPNGIVKTGDPVFLRLVDRLRITVGYRLAAPGPRRLTGTMQILVRLSGPTGWTRSIPLAPARRFAGQHVSSEVTLDLPRLRSLIARVETLTGAPSGGDYTLAVVSRLHMSGTLAGQPLTSDYAPALSFQLSALQLRPGSGSSTSADEQDGLTPARRSTVTASATAPNTLSIRGHGLPVATARWIALAGLLLAAAGALLIRLHQRRRPADPAAHIQTRYGHLIVPIAGMAQNPARPPIDVTSIDALVQLAERSERLILHHQRDDADTYLVDDEGTLYRYQTRPTGHDHRPTPSAPNDPARKSAAR